RAEGDELRTPAKPVHCFTLSAVWAAPGAVLPQFRGRREELIFGAEGDHQVAVFEPLAAVGVDMQRPVAPPQREHPRCIRAEQSDVVEGLANRRCAWADDHLLDADARLRVMQ